jgi:hypothetical protein
MTRRVQQDQSKPRKRWIIIGPGLVIAVILALQVAINNHKTSVGPPIVERQVLGGKVAVGPVSAPEIDYVLKQRDDLALTSHQVAVLTDLQSDWKTKSKPLMDDLQRSADSFHEFMQNVGDKAPMQDIQAHAAPVSELSRQVSSLRRVYWEKALQVLNKGQRSEIERQLSDDAAKRDLLAVGKESPK